MFLSGSLGAFLDVSLSGSLGVFLDVSLSGSLGFLILDVSLGLLSDLSGGKTECVE